MIEGCPYLLVAIVEQTAVHVARGLVDRAKGVPGIADTRCAWTFYLETLGHQLMTKRIYRPRIYNAKWLER